MPVVVGYEVAGKIDAVGPGTTEDWIGADVLALTRFGGYSDVICVPEAQVFMRPSGMDAAQGAALPVNYLTAWQLIRVMGSLAPGETMLVHSAGGGVGIAATQIAKKLGAKVIGTASAGKHEQLRNLGAEHSNDYTREDFGRACSAHAGRGVELILDGRGASFKRSSRACADRAARMFVSRRRDRKAAHWIASRRRALDRAQFTRSR